MPDLLKPEQAGSWARPFLRSMLSEDDGAVSSSRVCVALVIVFVLGFLTALLAKIHAPVTVEEFCRAVESLGMFTGGVTGTLYGINRAGNVFEKRADRP
ncbi:MULTISPECIES: hypothetical protein [Acidobacterium]|uniref:Lipoprotein n=1 Tax=Acidobacterium capsulatum (strain ATCC 51196 / DSM 11244 / BCRC 80197 / JCM 7670 / NBRC 15755 / NCIMB 13165 / 161) TaxID=240015 RepID=C1FA15_ACIC5|nr:MULTISPECIES: hypothetical protein [Acidobacterium]ACO32132.1 hypothetical protein ACP_0396 [Acidobacterium capsulatum ATCC 51196]HCT62063.1 hypothetical protein [Acidobacterium sp.]